MRDLGLTLRERREELGMSLDDLVTKTKIRKRYLIALEEGDWSQLPGDVYARGFVRSYAEHVGLDGHQLLEEYASKEPNTSHGTMKPQPGPDRSKGTEKAGIATSSGRAPTRNSTDDVPLGLSTLRSVEAKRTQTSRPKTRPRASHLGHHRPHRGIVGQATAVVGILVILGGGLWLLHRDKQSSVKSPMAPSSFVGSKGNRTAANAKGSQIDGTKGAATGENKPTVSTVGSTHKGGANGGAKLGDKAHQTASAVTVVSAPVIQGNRVIYSVSTNGPLSVELQASSRLWTGVTADGKSVDGAGGEILAQGQMKPFTANKEISFVIGNVPAASFTVNGQAVALPSITRTITVVFAVTSPVAGK